MDSFVDERDFALLAGDRYTFAVLDRILRGPCLLVRSDHRSVILCHSEAPYPVWVWTGDGCPEEDLERAWQLISALCPAGQEYRYNVKHSLADHFIRRARQNGIQLRVTMQMFAYDCPEPAAPDSEADGQLHVCTQEDLEEAILLREGFFREIGEAAPSRERSAALMQAYIDSHALFFWRNAAGKTVSCCSFRVNRDLACLNGVYTLPEERRRHYAQHLVYRVTRRAADAGYMPMLYTDADYTASNACYAKIGYVPRGRLCTLAQAR